MEVVDLLFFVVDCVDVDCCFCVLCVVVVVVCIG